MPDPCREITQQDVIRLAAAMFGGEPWTAEDEHTRIRLLDLLQRSPYYGNPYTGSSLPYYLAYGYQSTYQGAFPWLIS